VVFKKLSFKIEEGETEHILLSGKRVRRPTVLIRVGQWSLSRKAFMLGVLLVFCQVADGLLTYLGLRFTMHMEANVFIRELMHMYGTAPGIVLVKLLAIVIVVILTQQAHRRRWIRPLIAAVVAIYLVLAILPWTYLISQSHARGAIRNETAGAEP